MNRKNKETAPIPTDGLFKKIMCEVVAATEFLEYYLPDNFKNLVDLSTIKIEKESFVEDNLKRRSSDIIYSLSTKEGDKAYAYVLIEEQSSSDYWISFRLWKYVFLLLERHIKNKDKLPLVCPIVVYNGSVKYNAPANLWELFHNPILAKEIFTKDYKLIDLQATSDEEITKKQHLGMLEFMLKHIHARDTLKLIDEFLELFKSQISLDAEQGYIYLKSFIWYADSRLKKEEQPKLEQIINKHLTKDGAEIMTTIAQKYIEEGIEIGIAKSHIIAQKYKEEGRIELIQMMLKNGNTIADIAKWIGLPESEVKILFDMKLSD